MTNTRGKTVKNIPIVRSGSSLNMGETVQEWAQMWGARVKMPTDMRDDMLRDAIDTSRDALSLCSDFDSEGLSDTQTPQLYTSPNL